MTFEYLRQSLFFFRNHLGVIAKIQLPFLALFSFLSFLLTGDDNSDPAEIRQTMMILMIANFTLIPIYWGATIAYLGSVVENQPLTVSQALARSLSRWRHLLMVYLFTGIAVSAGLMLLIAPGIYFLIRFAFADYSCILEQQRPLQSMKSSWENSADYFWTLFQGMALLFVVLTGGQMILSQLLELNNPENALLAIPMDLLFGLLHSLITIYGFRVYCVMREENGQ